MHLLPRGLQIGTKLEKSIDSWDWISYTEDYGSNAGGWSASALREALQENGFVYNKFNSNFTKDIAYTKKYSQNGYDQGDMCTVTNDKFFILSIREMNVSYSSEPTFGIEGAGYAYWTTVKDTSKSFFTRAAHIWPHDKMLSMLGFGKDGEEATSSAGWLRSAHLDNNSEFFTMYMTNPSVLSASCGGGVIPAFSF